MGIHITHVGVWSHMNYQAWRRSIFAIAGVDEACKGNGDRDPLACLILVSTDDHLGCIPSDRQQALLDRLVGLLPNIPTTDEEVGGNSTYSRTEAFIEGLRQSIAAGADIEFG